MSGSADDELALHPRVRSAVEAVDAGAELVDPQHSRALAEALERGVEQRALPGRETAAPRRSAVTVTAVGGRVLDHVVPDHVEVREGDAATWPGDDRGREIAVELRLRAGHDPTGRAATGTGTRLWGRWQVRH